MTYFRRMHHSMEIRWGSLVFCIHEPRPARPCSRSMPRPEMTVVADQCKTIYCNVYPSIFATRPHIYQLLSEYYNGPTMHSLPHVALPLFSHRMYILAMLSHDVVATAFVLCGDRSRIPGQLTDTQNERMNERRSEVRSEPKP